MNELNFIGLYIYIYIYIERERGREVFVFNFGMARVASQRFVSRNTFVLRFLLPYIHLSTFVGIKNTRIGILRGSVQISASELRSETISCIFE